MRSSLLALLFLLTCFSLSAQSYTYYPTGDTTDVLTTTLPGTCMMGGASEHDNAMIWFLQRSGGGNILVIRASGSDGYNDYLYSDLGVDVQSVETIVFNNESAAEDPFVLDRISKAEAIWMAGGDQWNYVDYWRDSPVGQLLQQHVSQKQAPIGGTSAGMAVLGGAYFSAQNGTITSASALSNPYASTLTIGFQDFLDLPFLTHTITDTHYDDPDRKGRHMAFLARMASDHGVLSRGIACDEYTAVCIDENGVARVFGEYPTYDDNAYFLQANCEGPITPETCESGVPLTWDRSQAAVKVYHVQGDWEGSKYLDLNDWNTGMGGFWEHWWVQNGALSESPAEAPDCASFLSESHTSDLSRWIEYDPQFQSVHLFYPSSSFIVRDHLGRAVLSSRSPTTSLDSLPTGIYHIEIRTSQGPIGSFRIGVS
ncbi:MAG: cyanophycinase [Flavobacteriales bacterium]|nr:cyanophycinase [Flavobacteriales bacterium]